MATGSQGFAIAYPSAPVMEATATADTLRRKSLEGDYGVEERVYGINARTLPGISVEEYMFWAKIEREMEAEENRRYIAERGPITFMGLLKNRFSHGVHAENKKKEEKEEAERRSRALQHQEESNAGFGGDEKAIKGVLEAPPPDHARAVSEGSIKVTDAEWRTAARALRTASWGTICFLVTTDILGWSGCP